LKKIVILACIGLVLMGCSSGHMTLEERAKKIHKEVLTVDSHTDTPWALLKGDFDLDERHDYVKDKSRVHFPRMKEGGLDAIFFAAFIGQRRRDEEGNKKAHELVTSIIDSIHVNLARKTATSGLALSPDDAYRLEKEGKRAVFIGIENGYAIGKEINNIEKFYKKGTRYITLCHTRNNDICDSSTDSAEYNGLSAFGVDVVREMNRVGMMIDVSHISDSSFYDVIDLTKAPVIASHSCARAVCDNPRNLNDDMLVKLARNGGVIQMCILSDYVKKPEPYPARDSVFQAIKDKYGKFNNLSEEDAEKAWEEWSYTDSLFSRKLATVSDMVDHIDHMVKVAGIDHVGIGTDFDGGGGLADCVDASQLGSITLELVKRGYSEKDIKKIWGDNIMRVMRQVQKARQENS